MEWPGISQGLNWKEGREKRGREALERNKRAGERPWRGGALRDPFSSSLTKLFKILNSIPFTSFVCVSLSFFWSWRGERGPCPLAPPRLLHPPNGPLTRLPFLTPDPPPLTFLTALFSPCLLIHHTPKREYHPTHTLSFFFLPCL